MNDYLGESVWTKLAWKIHGVRPFNWFALAVIVGAILCCLNEARP